MKPMAPATARRTPMRRSGLSFSRVSASAARSAKPKSISQKPVAGETRARLSPGGVRYVPARPMKTRSDVRATKLATRRREEGGGNRGMGIGGANKELRKGRSEEWREREGRVAARR